MSLRPDLTSRSTNRLWKSTKTGRLDGKLCILLRLRQGLLFAGLRRTSKMSSPAAMSGRLLTQNFRTATRRASLRAVRHIHRFPTGGLLRTDAAVRATRKRVWFEGSSFHNAVIARNASFVRFLPKLVLKFARIPAMFGGLAIGGFAWVQYQAHRMARSPVRCGKPTHC